MKRISFLALAVVLMLSSCGDSDSDTPGMGSEGVAQTAAETEETAPDFTRSGNPEELDLNGETINLWYTMGWTSYIDLKGEQSGEILDDAIFAQNLAVQEKLNCTVEYIDQGTYQGECYKAISTLLLADDTSFDLFCATQWNGIQLMGSGMYLNIYGMPYLRLEAPWWDLEYMQQMSMGNDCLYGLVGDGIIDRLSYLSCVYYNKQLYQDMFQDADGMYQTVLDGDWTYETLESISKTVFLDLNNNGKTDEEDTIGARLTWNQDIMALAYCTGVPLTARDKDNIPYVVANSEKMIDITKKLYTMSYETDGILYGSLPEDQDIALAVSQFKENRSMFLFGQLQTSDYLRDMESDYGVIPTPKYDSEQKDYYSYMFEAMRCMMLPYNCTKPEIVCAFLEEMAFEGYTKVNPVYYETVLKGKYIRDDISGVMIDLVRDGLHTDFALAHITSWGSVACFVRDLICYNKSYDYVSYYKEREAIIESSGEKFINGFLGNT